MVSPELYLTVSRAHLPVPRPGGGLWVTCDLPGHAQTYSVEGAGAWPTRVAPSLDRRLPVGLTGHGLLVRDDQGGNETWQLGLVPSDGQVRRLTTDARAIHQSATVSPDGTRVGLAYNPDGQVDLVLAVLDLATGGLDCWLEARGMWSWAAWHPEREAAFVQHSLSPTRWESYLLDRGGELRPVLPAARRVGGACWTPDGRVLAISDLGSEFLRLVEVDSQGLDRMSRLYDTGQANDVEAFVPSHRGDRALVVVNEGMHDGLLLLDLTSGSAARVDVLPPGVVASDNVTTLASQVAWTDDDSRMFVAWETPAAPSDVYELPSGRRWTFAGASAIEEGLEPRAVRYPSFDGLEIPALHYRVDGTPRPTVVWFHGGPEAQFRAGHNPIVRMLVAGGFDVFAPNVRGSTGYGVRYFSLDDRERRWDSVRDGCEAARWLKREGCATKTAAMGGSYGGFMTLAVLVESPDLWDAAVDTVGIADWHTFFANTSGWRRAQRAAEYGDPALPEDAGFLADFSPLRRVEAIRAPLLVIHGRNDVRVPVSEAEQIAQATGARALIFDDEGHGIVKHGNRVRAYGAALEFLTEHLG